MRGKVEEMDLDSDSDPEENEGLIRIVDVAKLMEPASDEEGEAEDDKPKPKVPPVCPECGAGPCKRPVQEVNCGHVKCRQCFIVSEAGCGQCVPKAEEVAVAASSSEEEESEEEDEDLDKENVAPGRRYMCAYCNREFVYFSSCTRHLSVHC